MKRVLLGAIIYSLLLGLLLSGISCTKTVYITVTPKPTPPVSFEYPLSTHKGTIDDPVPLGQVLLYDGYALVVGSFDTAGGWVDVYELQNKCLEVNNFQVYHNDKYYDYDHIDVWHTVQPYCNIELRFPMGDVENGSLLVWEDNHYFVLE